MQTTTRKRALCAALALTAAAALAACGRNEAPTPAATATVTSPDQGTVPPPPGDSTPKAADSHTRSAAEGNEKTGTAQPQSTVGTAAAGAPPYTISSAPEGNAAPSQGTTAGEPGKK